MHKTPDLFQGERRIRGREARPSACLRPSKLRVREPRKAEGPPPGRAFGDSLRSKAKTSAIRTLPGWLSHDKPGTLKSASESLGDNRMYEPHHAQQSGARRRREQRRAVHQQSDGERPHRRVCGGDRREPSPAETQRLLRLGAQVDRLAGTSLDVEVLEGTALRLVNTFEGTLDTAVVEIQKNAEKIFSPTDGSLPAALTVFKAQLDTLLGQNFDPDSPQEHHRQV